MMELPVSDLVDHGIRLVEEERRRIARDLHDGPAQALTHISMRLDVISQLLRTDVEMAVTELSRTNSRVLAAVNDIRRLIFDLRPLAIDEIGLIPALGELCSRLSKEGPSQVWMRGITELPPLSPAKQVALYRLIQELLQNARKHAKAANINLTLSRDGDVLAIAVADDGCGFSVHDIPEGHYGLIGAHERAEFIGGNLEIDASPGRGSRFVLRVTCHG